MISDEDVIKLFRKCQSAQSKDLDKNRAFCAQFFRGKVSRNWKDHHPGGCKRDMTVFRQFNVIPKYCFDCYKVQIEPRTVMELIKLMMVFEKLELPLDNTRKCSVETREQVSGTYKGLIYCRGVEEGEHMLNMLRGIISLEISNEIKVTLKRGCSEYAIAYPGYAVRDGKKSMKYNKKWQRYEDIVDDNFIIDTPIVDNETNNYPTFTSEDTDTMNYWLKYAASIGDMSYLKISGMVIAPFADWKRSSPFNSVECSEDKAVPKIGRNDPCFCGSGKKYKRCCINLNTGKSSV